MNEEAVQTIARDTCPCGNADTHAPGSDQSCEWSVTHTRAVLAAAKTYRPPEHVYAGQGNLDLWADAPVGATS